MKSCTYHQECVKIDKNISTENIFSLSFFLSISLLCTEKDQIVLQYGQSYTISQYEDLVLLA